MKKAWFLSYPMSAQRRFWSDWADGQADLSLRWAHSHIVGVVMRRLKYSLLLLWWRSLNRHFSHDMTKPTKWVCAQRRLSTFNINWLLKEYYWWLINICKSIVETWSHLHACLIWSKCPIMSSKWSLNLPTCEMKKKKRKRKKKVIEEFVIAKRWTEPVLK